MKLTKAQLETENANLRTLCAEWAADAKCMRREILKLKDQSVARAPNTVVSSERQAAIDYCAKHGVNSVTAAELRREG